MLRVLVYLRGVGFRRGSPTEGSLERGVCLGRIGDRWDLWWMRRIWFWLLKFCTQVVLDVEGWGLFNNYRFYIHEHR